MQVILKTTFFCQMLFYFVSVIFKLLRGYEGFLNEMYQVHTKNILTLACT